MSTDDLAVGLVGCGRLAEAGYLPALADTPGMRLVAVADPDPARREHVAALAAAGRPGTVRAVADTASLLEATRLDALILATPAAAHLDDARRAAEAGIPTLVEKPPAPDAATAAALAALDPAPWVGFNRRFDPGAQALRATIPDDGELRLRLRIHYRRRSWGPVAVHDDALLDLGPHLVDWARWLTRSRASQVVSARLQPDSAHVELLLDRGSAEISASTNRPHAELIEVRDREGALVGRHRLGGLAAAVAGRLRGRGADAMATTLAAQLAVFARAARGEPAPDLGRASEGHAVMQVIDAARSSALAGHPVSLSDPVEP